ncbi:hypothetical protein [Niveibacterium sp. COAC-50]|uniref:hypothetical protein n=1 Tax=Niveibacterium sp. COAC-50 TaxID=2729384 RepID=UPI0015581A4F|nr:hypothetical protein [Niveibacterium sp. COAC-50]
MPFCYAFEAKSIQSWILDSGRMAEMVAASSVVDALCEGPLDALASRLDVAGDIRWARRAGGAFYALADSAAPLTALRDAWSLAMPGLAPGLEFIHAIVEGGSDFAALSTALQQLGAQRNEPAISLPLPGPLAEREARTGLPAVRHVSNGSSRKQGFVSAPTLRKRGADLDAAEGVGERMLPPEASAAARDAAGLPRYVWPRNLEQDGAEDDSGNAWDFPFLGSGAVAVVHADGNGLGQVLIRLQGVFADDPRDYAKVFRGFSDCIGRATLKAAQHACEKVLLPQAVRGRAGSREVLRLPARPIVLGGDDLTIIVRADLALDFTEAFLSAFEIETRSALGAWHASLGGRSGAAFETLRRLDHLTACAGAVFVRSSQPFYMAYELSESLCKFAKQRSGAVAAGSTKPASLAFARITNSLDEEAGSPFAASIDLPGSGPAHMSLGAYATSSSSGLPALADLRALAGLLASPDMARGPARTLLNTLELDGNDAVDAYRRWRETMTRRDREGTRSRIAALDALLGRFGSPLSDAPFVRGDAFGTHQIATPLADAQDLIAVGALTSHNEVGA